MKPKGSAVSFTRALQSIYMGVAGSESLRKAYCSAGRTKGSIMALLKFTQGIGVETKKAAQVAVLICRYLINFVLCGNLQEVH